jgi:hypothetical protein
MFSWPMYEHCEVINIAVEPTMGLVAVVLVQVYPGSTEQSSAHPSFAIAAPRSHGKVMAYLSPHTS